ncbi:MAG: hypothetical protein Kow001_06440 [Acidobacteriota bacterium]
MQTEASQAYSPDFASDIRLFVSSMRKLDSLPAVALKVIELAAGDDASRQDITRIIQSDAGLASQVIKVANSAWLGYGGRVGTLDRAMALLGMEMVRNIALSVLVSDFFLRSQETGRLRTRDLWYHCLASAVTAEQFARRLRYPRPAEAFVAGLLHDLGKIVLLRWDNHVYSELAAHAQKKRLPMHRIERAALGIDHAVVGGLLLEDWKFPEALSTAVAEHHSLADKEAAVSDLGRIVACADAFCHLKRFGFSGHSSPEIDLDRLREELSLSSTDLKDTAVEVISRFEEAAGLFNCEGNLAELYLSAVARANQELAEMYTLLVERTREHELAECELRQKEEQLNRSQRLEAVGQLAGGIAHDFNNFLTVIMGFADLLREGIPKESHLRQHVETIVGVAERAANLTRQLLAFSRRQVLRPKVLLLNSLVSDVQKLLVRLIGEDIKLTTTLDPNLWPVKVDPGGIEQVIVNLAVNARDAMENGGTLSIETANVELKEDYTDSVGHIRPGRYVMLQVSDTGHGMTPETQERIFEPFFTTKKKGTGMGLATVYGIVKQSGGYIFVESEVGKGSRFKVFFEPVDQVVDREVILPAVEAFESGTETVLIAEDEKEILELVARILSNVGYNVLTAANGEEALRVAAAYPGPIHLLLTDAVMPIVNGRELVERLRPERPNMKVVFMSGYTGTGILHRAVAGQDISFIAKPFTPADLLRKIQKALES